jgi:hypothetical protein
MKSLVKYIFFAGISAAILNAAGCTPKSESITVPFPAEPAAKKANVPHPVPDELSFAKDFLQSLVDAGWTVREVRNSKFNSFFRDTGKAAFIRTERGVVEAVFFESEAEVEQISVSEQQTGDLRYRRYIVRKPPLTNQRIEGGASCYFTKHRNVFIITTDPDLNDALKESLPMLPL